jgi:hypothetical protein
MAIGNMLGRMLVPGAVVLVFGFARRYMPVRPQTKGYTTETRGHDR